MAQRPANYHGEFRYQKLDNDNEFRILTMLPAKPDGYLRCKLQHEPLPATSVDIEPRPYDAISWYWGADESLAHIYILNDKGNEEMLSVRPNLIEALQGLQDKQDPAKRFWIDAVCINQRDTHERDLQVQHMFKIYGCAQNVCIWLGKHKDNSALALKFIRERVCDLGAFEETTKDMSASEEWKALAALMNRPWFSRRWVVQELALAKRATVHCEDEYIQWADFETAVALFERDAQRIALQFRGSSVTDHDPDIFGDVSNMRATRLVQAKSNLFRMNDQGQIMERRWSLSDLVSNLSFFEAKEPRDLIYAILSLAEDTHARLRTAPPGQDIVESPIIPDYSGETADTLTTGPIMTSPPARTAEEPMDQSRNTNNGSNSLDRQESIVEIDGKRLEGNMKRAFKNAVGAIKQGPQLGYSRRFPPVNYKQPFFALCREFLMFTIPKKDSYNLDILCRPWAPKAPGEEPLPSWIPSISNAAFDIRRAPHAPGNTQMKRKNADPLVGQMTYRTPYYNACKTSESNSTFAKRSEWSFGSKTMGESERSLFVTGHVLDKIGEIKDASQNGHVPLDWIELGEWEPWDERGEHDPENHPPDTLWRTLIADRGPDGNNTKVYYRQAFEYAVINSTHGVGLQAAELKQRSNTILVEVLDRIQAVVWNRRLFRSKRGANLGLAPKAAKEGDYICIIKGCSVPVILRWDGKNFHYEFIGKKLKACKCSKCPRRVLTKAGECYLHSMMDGQAAGVQASLLEEYRVLRGDSTNLSEEEQLLDWHMFELR